MVDLYGQDWWALLPLTLAPDFGFTLIENKQSFLLKHCCVSLQSLVWFKQTEHATRPHSCLCSLSFAHSHSHTHSCLHLDGRRCVTNGNTLSFDELIFSFLMLTGHTLRKHGLTPFMSFWNVPDWSSNLILFSELAADPWGPNGLGFLSFKSWTWNNKTWLARSSSPG